MDFNDYINNLNDLDNQENRTELKTFYTLNSTTIKFFKTIDKAILDLLACPNISSVAVKQLEGVLPVLTKLKRELTILDKDILSDGEINSLVDYIKNSMPVNEVEIVFQEFHDLYKKKEDLITRENERKRREQEQWKIKAEEGLKQENAEPEKLKPKKIISQFPTQIEFNAQMKMGFGDVGGKLFITPKQLIFSPNRFELCSSRLRTYNIANIQLCEKKGWLGFLYIYFNDGSKIRLIIRGNIGIEDQVIQEIEIRREALKLR